MRKYVKYTLTQRKMSVKSYSTAQHSTSYLFVFSDRKNLTLTDRKINCRHAGEYLSLKFCMAIFCVQKYFRRRKIHDAEIHAE